MTVQELIAAVGGKGFSVLYDAKSGQVLLKEKYKGAKLSQQLRYEFEERTAEVAAYLGRPRYYKDADPEWSERCSECKMIVFRAVLVSGCCAWAVDGINSIACPYKPVTRGTTRSN